MSDTDKERVSALPVAQVLTVTTKLCDGCFAPTPFGNRNGLVTGCPVHDSTVMQPAPYQRHMEIAKAQVRAGVMEAEEALDRVVLWLDASGSSTRQLIEKAAAAQQLIRQLAAELAPE